MKKMVIVFLLVSSVIDASNIKSPTNPNACSDWYTDEFGPTQSNYSMGDFVRYTVTPGVSTAINPLPKFKGTGLNLYYGMADVAYAQDAFNCVHNATNLYNFIGNLYAGYAALHINPSEYILGQTGTVFDQSPWMTTFRTPNQGMSGSLGFDNNILANYTTQLVDFSVRNIITVLGSAFLGLNSNSLDTGQYLSNIRTREYGTSKLYPLSKATGSCSWIACDDDGHYVLAVETPGVDIQGYVAPYGQFWGARLSHILGAVTNDVPVSKAAAISSTWQAMPTGTPTPPVAIFSTSPAAIAGSTIPSTAHFGSMMNFVNYWLNNKVTPAIKNSTYYSYVAYHLLPTLQRFATGGPSLAPLCSYQLTATSTGANLIEINDANMTSYDNGIIVGIENNTGKDLYVKQCVKGASDNQIGVLKSGSNNYFLNTASLMQSTANNSTAATPPLGNVIEFKDSADDVSIYVQVMNPTQLQTLITNLNSALNSLSNSAGGANSAADNFVYNQNANNEYQQPTSSNAAYLVITNFDANNLSKLQGNNLIMARVQALDIGAFEGQPYFATIRIDKEQVGYGLNSGSLMQGIADSYILYPSILSVKTFSWLNPYAQTQGASYYSQMPLLLLPDLVANAGIKGLAANYGIWLMSYAAAMTEFQFNCTFGDTLDCLNKTFNIFSVTNQSAPACVVIDANNVLQSGQTMTVLPTVSDQQSNATYLTLMGSDVWDCGQNFHQDIPVLHLYADAAGNPVANQQGAEHVNLLVTFELEKITKMQVRSSIPKTIQPGDTVSTAQSVEKIEEVAVSTHIDNFADGYGQPYNNIMLFSVPTANLKQGVRIEWLQYQPGYYQMVLKDETEAHNVLAVQKVHMPDAGDILQVSLNFMNSDDRQWGSMVVIPETVTDAPINHTRSCLLKYNDENGQNSLSVVPVHTLVDKKAKKLDLKQPKDLEQDKKVKKAKKAKKEESNKAVIDKKAKKKEKKTIKESFNS